ncbi:MAG: phosphonate metabolism protein/1,5-bisphosphokinase (PRPP-forming) PhnN [Hyphomicrobiaceae bacterium]|nr:phosphonate metabolism protein/1,5-bisphosphokinase (PRPP-forming) PhnN [Hyphomicrobiaceae bacterium]
MSEGHGALVLVVGPSGAGKDTLMRAAAERLRDQSTFLFPRRMVTRVSDGRHEDHDSISREDFDFLVSRDRYTLAWEAHGLGYIIPQSVEEEVRTGRIAVCNVSRSVVDVATRHAINCAVILVTADHAVREARLNQRQRDSDGDLQKRLEREGSGFPEGVQPFIVDNSGELERGIAAFLDALLSVQNELGNGRRRQNA